MSSTPYATTVGTNRDFFWALSFLCFPSIFFEFGPLGLKLVHHENAGEYLEAYITYPNLAKKLGFRLRCGQLMRLWVGSWKTGAYSLETPGIAHG